MFFLIFTATQAYAAADAEKIVKNAFDYWRGKASVSTTDMTIHRPDWERTMTIKAWTEGEKNSLLVVTSPSKDKGNGTLKLGPDMWIFNPKINRVIKLPPSMMSQSWQGSDFSNNDLAKSDTLLHDFTHKLHGEEKHEGKRVFLVTSMPKADAPVIWGMLRMKIREDHILLEETFYDENLEPVKTMKAWDIRMNRGHLFPMRWSMGKADKKNEYTLLVYRDLVFKDKIDISIFSHSNLKNPKGLN